MSSQRPARQPGQVDDAAGLLDDLGTSIGNAMGNLASALRNLQPPQRLPALRPIRAALRATKPSPDAALVGVTDLLVDAVDTLSNIVRASIQE